VEALQSPRDDLLHRRPVWQALSSLFLDTDTSLDRAWRARLLAESPYTMEQLQLILSDEVCPVCAFNLLSVAGVWSGFDITWLEREILRGRKSPLRAWGRLGLPLITMHDSVEWTETKRLVLVNRSGQESA
jgi:hypothetical protein